MLSDQTIAAARRCQADPEVWSSVHLLHVQRKPVEVRHITQGVIAGHITGLSDKGFTVAGYGEIHWPAALSVTGPTEVCTCGYSHPDPVAGVNERCAAARAQRVRKEVERRMDGRFSSVDRAAVEQVIAEIIAESGALHCASGKERDQ